MADLDPRVKQIISEGNNPTLPIPKEWNREITLRPYQTVGATLLAVNKRFLLGDPPGAGKTFQEAYATLLVGDLLPKWRWWVLTTVSACNQWRDELLKVLPRAIIFTTSNKKPAQRFNTVKDWVEEPSSILITPWSQLLRDWDKWKSQIETIGSILQVTADEAQKLSNPDSAVSRKFSEISQIASRVHGLTGTLMKNSPLGVQAIVEAICPGTMPRQDFETAHCIIDYVPVSIYSTKTEKIVRGYKDLDKYRDRITPIYLTRDNTDLAGQRPEVVLMIREFDLSPPHKKIYREAEKGLYSASSEAEATTCLIHAQQATSCPEKFQYDSMKSLTSEEYKYAIGKNSKLLGLLDLLQEELLGEQVAIYSPFRTTIDWYERAVESLGPTTRITGTDTPKQRDESRAKFLSGDSQYLFLTDAGGEALNLQVAKHLVFLNRPYDPGRYLQVLGRIHRIGSKHDFVTIWHLNALDTVDEVIDAMLKEKFDLFKVVSGQIPFDTWSGLPLEVAKKLYHKRRLTNHD